MKAGPLLQIFRLNKRINKLREALESIAAPEFTLRELTNMFNDYSDNLTDLALTDTKTARSALREDKRREKSNTKK